MNSLLHSRRLCIHWCVVTHIVVNSISISNSDALINASKLLYYSNSDALINASICYMYYSNSDALINASELLLICNSKEKTKFSNCVSTILIEKRKFRLTAYCYIINYYIIAPPRKCTYLRSRVRDLHLAYPSSVKPGSYFISLLCSLALIIPTK